ncbi:SH3 domain-containing protein [Amycolatopsis kentuckyensis]|uniref:SH3 domain-containing protein n=1 Tax=Amycolatopsis kentuckyensis TaxID=218823 RepID=UPI003565A48E
MKRSNLRRTAGLGVVLATIGALAVGGALEASAAATGTVKTAGDALNVRRAPTASATAVKTVANGASVTIDCQITGTSVTGTYGTSTLWDYVPALGGYISDTYVYTGSDLRIAPDCGVGSGSGQCADACAGEATYRSSDSHFLVYDKNADGYSAVVAYWLKGGAGPFYVWNSGGEGSSVDKAVSVPHGGWVFYKVCVANYTTAKPALLSCSDGITDFAA